MDIILYKYSATSRVVDYWNALPDADCKAFKGNYDRFMRDSRGQS